MKTISKISCALFFFSAFALFSGSEAKAAVEVKGTYVSHPRPHAWYCKTHATDVCYSNASGTLVTIAPNTFVNQRPGLPNDTIWRQCTGCE